MDKTCLAMLRAGISNPNSPEGRKFCTESCPYSPDCVVVFGKNVKLQKSETKKELHPDLKSAYTPRELEILELLSRGMTNAAITNELVINVKTVEHHLNSIYSKFKERHGGGPDVHLRVSTVLDYVASKDMLSVECLHDLRRYHASAVYRIKNLIEKVDTSELT